MNKIINNVMFYLWVFILSILIGLIIFFAILSLFAKDLGYGGIILVYISIGIIPISFILFITSSLIFKNKILSFLIKVSFVITTLFLIPLLILLKLATQ